MCNYMCLLSAIQQPTTQAVVDLIAELVAAELNGPGRVKFRYQNSKALRSEMLSDTAKVLDAELLAEAENSMDKDNIHSQLC